MYCFSDVPRKLVLITVVFRRVTFTSVCPVRVSGRNRGRPKITASFSGWPMARLLSSSRPNSRSRAAARWKTALWQYSAWATNSRCR